ncbi:Hypothetical protein SMAX5B_001865 [Scophthalmus maximus]|uniref:Uncharacterized protein n=1 Tax=Scophthalmus maximus TaxID=52904 RepID=A0A2U9CVV1_SCOMX|nr:Hypothetical protein SMAX5B_001865 [Scophthalmus maximus]
MQQATGLGEVEVRRLWKGNEEDYRQTGSEKSNEIESRGQKLEEHTSECLRGDFATGNDNNHRALTTLKMATFDIDLVCATT